MAVTITGTVLANQYFTGNGIAESYLSMASPLSGEAVKETLPQLAMSIVSGIAHKALSLKFNYYVLQQLAWVVFILLLGSLLFAGPWVWPTEDSATIEWLQEISEKKGPTYEKFFSSETEKDRAQSYAMPTTSATQRTMQRSTKTSSGAAVRGAQTKAQTGARVEARIAELQKTLAKKRSDQESESLLSKPAEPRFPLWAVGVGAGTLALAQLSLFVFGSYSGLGSSL
jgi:hypothetical protein